MKIEWDLSRAAEELFGDWFRSMKCPDCGAIHNQEGWHYQDGDFGLTITVDMCPKARTK